MNVARSEAKFIAGSTVYNYFLEKDEEEMEVDIEEVKRSYCASFVHEGCGGAPDAYVGILIGCTECDATWDGSGPLGDAIERAGEFKSLRI